MSLKYGDLTTVANFRAYSPSGGSDALIQSAITRMSRFVLAALNRPSLVPQNYKEQYDGTGTVMLVLPNFPVLDNPLLTLVICGCNIQMAPQIANNGGTSYINGCPFGFRYQSWNGIPPGIAADVELVGGALYIPGRQNVVVTYKAGYQVTGEALTIEATSYTPIAPYGIWATDQGVTYTSSGLSLTPMPAGTILAAGQYIPPAPDITVPVLNYTFAAADIGQQVLINYGFIPAEVEQLMIDLTMERLAYRGRIGIRSQALAGQETITYDTSGLTSYIQSELCQYFNPIPPNMGYPV